MTIENMKYSRTFLIEVQDELMKMTDTKLLVNAVRVLKHRFKLLDQYKGWLDTFAKTMGCDNYPNAMKRLKKQIKDFQDAKDLIEEIRVISGARGSESIPRIIKSRFIGEYPDWLEVPSPSWKGKEKTSNKMWHRNCKVAYKKMLVWLDENPEDGEKIMEEARLSYLCGSATTFISSCERLYLLAKMEEFSEIEAQYKRMKKLGGDPDKTFNYRSARVLKLRDDDAEGDGADGEDGDGAEGDDANGDDAEDEDAGDGDTRDVTDSNDDHEYITNSDED